MKIEHRGFECHFPTESSPLPWSHWEVVGMAAWLWARSRLHRSWDLALLEQEVMSSVQLNQFVLLTQQDRPAGYLSWGHLSEEAEVSYIADPHSLSLQDKCSGPFLWLLNWVAPQGGTEAFTWLARHRLFHRSVGHMLRVKPRQPRHGPPGVGARKRGVPRRLRPRGHADAQELSAGPGHSPGAQAPATPLSGSGGDMARLPGLTRWSKAIQGT